MGEFVSCIMVTRDRPRFVKQAIRYFLRQTYTDSELVVVDDGEEPVEKTCSGLDRVRYMRLRRPTPTGTKLNIGIDRARGQILQKLDDDDYYHPDFLKTAVTHLEAAEWDRAVAGWDCFLILLAGELQARFSGHGWMAGGTLCFSRELWERAPFRDVPVNEDYWFLQDHEAEQIGVQAPELYLLVRHGGNTWMQFDNGFPVDEFVQSFPLYRKPLEELVDAPTLAFYRRCFSAGDPK